VSPATRFLVIGGGPAGVAAATVAASGGAQVTLVEVGALGGASQLGDCLPSKALVASVTGLAGIRASGHLGSADPGPLRPDAARLTERRQAVGTLLTESLRGRLEALGVDLRRGRARFVEPQAVLIDDGANEEVVGFDAALIATGAAPYVPEWAAPDGERVITSRQAYRLAETPEHLVVIGAGATGVELAHIFSSLGSQVTLMASRGRLLPGADIDAAAALEEEFAERGITIRRGARARQAGRRGPGVEVVAEDGRTIAGSHALLAVGLQPAVGGLGLEAAGVSLVGGAIGVDALQRTSNPCVYAAGDVTGHLMLSSVAAAEGAVVGRQVLGLPAVAVDRSAAAQAVFTEPQIAWAGLQEATAAASGRKVRVGRAAFSSNPGALISARPRGFAKLIVDPEDDTILGGLIVGRHAAELIGMVALAVRARVPRGLLADTLLAYPSLAETLAAAAR
jgi:NAD(P)H dehydrogenase (quinone)